MSSRRKLLTCRGGFVLGALLLLCGLVFFAFSRLPQGTVAIVERNGQEVLQQELSRLDGPKEAEIKGENGIVLTVVFYPDGAAVLSSQCPDKICVNKGKLTRAGESALCLPARVSLRLEGGAGTDGTTY